jgi:glycosyltransferase involved in cell wall biosynthesis
MKRPTARSKGILVLTHKELPQVLAGAPGFARVLARVREKFVIGVHYGWFRSGLVAPAWVDFHFAPESTVTFDSPAAVRALPFNSSHFTPACFRDLGLAKHWDIVSVTRPVAFKNTHELLRSLRLVSDRRPHTRALVVCAGTTDTREPAALDALWQQYLGSFSASERQDIVFLPFQLAGAPFPFPRQDVAWLYNSSRLFTLFSSREGGSKAIKEALLCGLPVVLKRGLTGGGLEFANAGNSRLFGDEAEAAQAICEVLDNPSAFRFDAEAIAQRASERFTVPLLLERLERLFQELGLLWEGDVDTQDLSTKLPSHHPELIPSALKRHWTSDLSSPRTMLAFLAGLVEVDGAPRVLRRRDTASVELTSLAQRGQHYLRGLRRRLARSSRSLRAR